jgi:hypothetical protein
MRPISDISSTTLKVLLGESIADKLFLSWFWGLKGTDLFFAGSALSKEHGSKKSISHLFSVISSQYGEFSRNDIRITVCLPCNLKSMPFRRPVHSLWHISIYEIVMPIISILSFKVFIVLS